MLTAYKESTSAVGNNTDGILASEIGAKKSVDVDVYVFYDGSEDNVYTQNITNLKSIGATITFTATPVNTQDGEINAPNAAKEPLTK